jgi:hypothetical protein
MCDYSLEVYGSRPAREGERYVTSRFPSGTIGLTSPKHASTAVCLNCDTALEINGIPESMCREFGIIRFSNGAEVTLQKFPPGVGFAVKQLLENVKTPAGRHPVLELMGLA